jgi:6-phospho-beta-glucosidase
MHYARPDGLDQDAADMQLHDVEIVDTAGEGYAGVALDIIEAFESNHPVQIGLNVVNGDAIPCMRPDDVVEVSCLVDGSGIHPQPIGEIPEEHELLMRSVKRYERLTVEAIRSHSRKKAILALMAHPLVMSYSLAMQLVDEYLEAHAAYIGEWS